MAVSRGESWGRVGFGVLLVGLALVVLCQDWPGRALLEPLLRLLAAFGAIGALAAYGSENAVPVRVRGADLVGLAAAGVALFAGALADLDGLVPLGIAYGAFVAGTTGRSILGETVATPIVAAVGAIFLGLAGIGAWVSGSFAGLPTALAVGGAGLIVLYGVLDRGTVEQTVSSRSFQYGGGALLLSSLAGALGIGCYALALRYDHTWDLTRTRAFTLSDHAAQVARGLSFDVRGTAFYRPSTPSRDDLEELLDLFRGHTDRIAVEWVDPLREPRRAKEAQITGDQGTLLLTANGQTRRLEGEVTEEELVRALVLLGSSEDHEVCWTMGHGEPDPDDEISADGLGIARLQLESLNYQVRKLLTANVGVPRNCDLVIVARPSEAWLPFEYEALVARIAEGGRVLMLIDAGDPSPDLSRLGVSLGNDVVLDLNKNNQLFGVDDPSVVVLSPENYGAHPITRSLSAALILPVTRSVQAIRDLPGVEAVDLLHTSPEAWGETDTQTAPPSPDPATERIGEVSVLTVVTVTDPTALKVVRAEGKPASGVEGDVGRAVPADFAPAPGGRLVVIGDSDFVANQYVDLGNNRDLFLNAIAWLADEEAQIGERPAPSEKLTISTVGEALWFLLSVVVVPGAALLGALGTWVYRRTYL